MEIILVINSGSSSIKFQALNFDNLAVVASGLLERIYVDGFFSMKLENKKIGFKTPLPNHQKATEFLITQLKKEGVLENIDNLIGIGHRIVQGGTIYKKAQILSEEDLIQIEKFSPLAPLHNPGALSAIRAFQKVAPKAVNLGDFDTAFHQTIPPINHTYALPLSWREENGVKRYGAHGISYEYITHRMAHYFKKPVNEINLIIAHLGNGASIAAIKNGQSYNTSMGLTPLAGLIMGTRSGDIDPSILSYIATQRKLTLPQITDILNRESGIKALSGSADMRDIEEKINNKDPKAIFTIELWAARIADYIVMYYNQLGGLIDGIIFTAGIGENSPFARQKILEAIKTLPFVVDIDKNWAEYDKINCITTNGSKIPIYVTRTNEELLIAEKVKNKIKRIKND